VCRKIKLVQNTTEYRIAQITTRQEFITEEDLKLGKVRYSQVIDVLAQKIIASDVITFFTFPDG
jgi:hypothetical protein